MAKVSQHTTKCKLKSKSLALNVSCGIVMLLFYTAHFCSVPLLIPFSTWDKCILSPLFDGIAQSPGSHFL